MHPWVISAVFLIHYSHCCLVWSSNYTQICYYSEDAILKDSYDGKDVLSALSFAAETITCRIKHKVCGITCPIWCKCFYLSRFLDWGSFIELQNQWKFVAAVLSICYECYTGASTDFCISKVFAFLMNMVPFLTTKFCGMYCLPFFFLLFCFIWW